MSDSLIGTIISGVFALAVALLTVNVSRKKDAIAQAKRDQRTDDAINELSKRIDAHNGLSDKIIDISKAIVRIETKIESLHK